MRTKVLLCAALLAAGLATSQAQSNVYSLNVVGYINISVTNSISATKSQFDFFSNPLTNSDMSVSNTLITAVKGTLCYVWNTNSGTYDIYTKRTTVWTGGTTYTSVVGLQPGIPFFLVNPSFVANETITLVGSVPQGSKAIHYGGPSTYNFIAYPFPVGGLAQTTLGLPAVKGDAVYLWTESSQIWSISTRRTSTWTGGTGEPNLSVAGGMYYYPGANQTAGNWSCTFNVQ
jgi:hypothetical protein